MSGDIQARQFSQDLDRLLTEYQPIEPTPQPAVAAPTAPPRPFGISTLAGAARNTLPGWSLIENIMEVSKAPDLAPVPGYDVFADAEMRAYVERSPEAFIGVQSPAHARLVIGRLDRDAQYQTDIAASPLMGLLTEGAVGLLDPLLVGKFKAGANFASRAVSAVPGGVARGVTSEALIGAGNPERTPEEALFGVSAFAILNAATSGAFGRAYKGNVAQAEADAAQILGGEFKSAGAAAAANARQVAPGGEALKPAPLNLEKLPDTPVRRVMAKDEELGQQTVTEMVDLGGMAQNKNTAAGGHFATASPVEREMVYRYRPQLVDALREGQRNYLVYRERMQASDPTPSIDWEMLKLGASDLVKGRGAKLGWAEFREEVGKALHSGDTHDIPEVAAAARAHRRVLDHVKKLGMDEDVFTVEMRRELKRLQDQLHGLNGAARLAVEGRILKVTQDIDSLRKSGPEAPPNAQSYFPLIVRQDKIDADIAGFKQVLTNHLREKGLRGRALTEGVENLYKTIRAQDPYKRLQPDAVGLAKSLKGRELDIPVEKLFPWLELDAEAVTRQYVRAMSADIELTRKFGSPDMGERLDEIAAAWREKTDNAKGDSKALRAIEKDRDAALSDLRALRDRIRGTYGLPDEPYSVTAATLRGFKSFNYLTMMGGVALSSLPDPVRVWMTEGFDRAFGAGLKTLIQEPAIFKAAAKEIELTGEAMDAVLGGRAAAFLDTGNMLGKSYPLERALGVASEQMSFLNVIHAWSDTMKKWAGAVTGSRIVEVSVKLAKGTADAAEIEKLAKSGIDKPMAERIAREFEQYGVKGKRLFVAGSEDWTDEVARDAFRSALIADVNRTIVTPGFGDTPLWTSTQFGSTIAQFKKFGMASTTRILVSGLQENDAAFWGGALALVAAGGIASAIKDKVQYGHDYTKRTWQDQLLTAVDRSGLAGWFMDAHNAMEKLTDHRVGLHNLLGDRIKRDASFASKIGAVLGPSAQQMATATNIAADMATLDFDKWTARNLRRLVPGQSLFWAQPFYDTLEDLAYPGPQAGRQQGHRFLPPPPLPGAF